MDEIWLARVKEGMHIGRIDIIKVRKMKYPGDSYTLEHYAYGNIGWWPIIWGVEYEPIKHIINFDSENGVLVAKDGKSKESADDE